MNETNSRRLVVIWPGFAVLAGLSALGCQPGLELIPVHGEVRYQGNPLEYGSVMFQPKGNGPLARGTINSDGTFVLGTNTIDDGVRRGVCRVRVTSLEAQKTGSTAHRDRELALGRSAIPKKYQSFGTSELTVDVRPGMELPVVLNLD